jgi:large subunit ribosomal protein L24e
MPTCTFCKKSYNFPRGLTLFTFDGKSLHYCSSKCKNNAALKRDPKKTNWVKREKKMTNFEKEAQVVKEKEEKAAEVEEEKAEKAHDKEVAKEATKEEKK